MPDSAGVYFVPAFGGLLAPWWRDDARGALLGLTQYTQKVWHLNLIQLYSALLSCMQRAAYEGSPLLPPAAVVCAKRPTSCGRCWRPSASRHAMCWRP